MEIIETYLRSVRSGDAGAPDHQLLRECAALCASLPALDGDARRALDSEVSDGFLAAYLTTLTSAAASLAAVTERFNVAFSKQRKGGVFGGGVGGVGHGGGGGADSSFMG